jgi:hypothetical protein
VNTVGIFAGRGDVILAMALSFGAGIIFSWYIRTKLENIKSKWKTWRNK